MLSRESILAADDLTRIPVQVPEWNGTVYVRVLSLGEQKALHARLEDGTDDVVLEYIAACAVDEQGHRLFSSDDIASLATKSGKALRRVFDAAVSANAMSSESIDDAKKA